MKLTNAFAAVAAIGLAVAVWNLVDASGSEAPVSGRAADRVAELEQRVEQLSAQAARARVHHLARVPRTMPVPVPTDGSKSGDAGFDADADADDADTGASEPAVPVEAQLEAAFAADAPDSDWTRRAPVEAEDALRELLPDGSRLGAVECRGNLCRVEIRHDGDDGHAAFVETLMGSQPRWSGPGSYTRVRDERGDETTLAFLGEPGSDLVPGSAWLTESAP